MIHILVFLACFITALLSASAGGGGGMLTTPLLLALGLEPLQVLASLKLAGVAMQVGALQKLRKNKISLPITLIFALSLLVVPAALIGTNLTLSIDQELLKKVILVLCLFLVIIALCKPSFGEVAIQTSTTKKLVGYFAYFVVLIIQAGFSSGSGMLLIFILPFFFGLPLIQSIGVRRIIGLLTSVTASIIFGLHGAIDYSIALSAAIAFYSGGYAGMHIAIARGNQFVKKILLVIICLTVLFVFISS